MYFASLLTSFLYAIKILAFHNEPIFFCFSRHCYFYVILYISSLNHAYFVGSKCCRILEHHWGFGREWKSDCARYRNFTLMHGHTHTILFLSGFMVVLLVNIHRTVTGFFAGRNLSMLPVEPKLGKMLIFGAIFNCLDPIMTVVSGLSTRDPFLMPFDKKDVSFILCLMLCIDDFICFSMYSRFLFSFPACQHDELWIIQTWYISSILYTHLLIEMWDNLGFEYSE